MPVEKRPMIVLMLCPCRHLYTMAFVVETIIAMAENGHRVSLLISDRADPPVEIKHPNVDIETYRDIRGKTAQSYLSYFRASWKKAKQEKPDVIIGLTQVGVITAGAIHRYLGIPFVYYNDELIFGNERGSVWRRLGGRLIKVLEQRANRRALFTVTQGPMRGEILSKINRIALESLRYLPNSRSGSAKLSSSRFMQERFRFPDGIRTILWMGAIMRGDGALELAREAVNWPQDYRLVFHFLSEHIGPYGQEILAYHNQGQVFVSSKPIDYHDVEQLAASATIGLGIYVNKGSNSRYIGQSSGKINTFLKCGIPCIVRDFEGLRWVQECGAGVCVKDSSCVFLTAQEILSNYDQFRENAIKVFEKHLNFDNAFSKILIELKQSVGR